MDTFKVLGLEIAFLPDGSQKGGVSVSQNQPHVGGDRDYDDGRKTMDVHHTVMNHRTDAEGMSGCKKACHF